MALQNLKKNFRTGEYKSIRDVQKDQKVTTDVMTDKPVVNLGLKEILNEVFGFIKVGGDFS